MPRMNDSLISARRLSKCFSIYEKAHHPLLDLLSPAGRKRHREFWALKNVSFDVGRGETVGIIGRNGSGKSTLLQLICGTLTATDGTVETRGRISALLELGSGFNPEFTGQENVFLNGAILGMSRDQIAERYGNIVAFADIGDFIDQPVKTYSSGMVVRLAFATAIHVSPDVLVVDEALAVGDTPFQTKCLTRIRELQANGVSILLVTHNLNTIIEYCDRAIYLRRGAMVGSGPARDIAKLYSEELVSAEGGVCADRGATTESPRSPLSVTKGADRISATEHQGIEIHSVEILGGSKTALPLFSFGDDFLVRLGVRAHGRVAVPCFGIQIKSVDGIVLWSVTSQMLGLQLEPLEADEERFVAWNLRANFAGSRYVVAVGAGEIKNGQYIRHMRLDYAGHFNVQPRPSSGTGWLDPFATLESALTGGPDVR